MEEVFTAGKSKIFAQFALVHTNMKTAQTRKTKSVLTTERKLAGIYKILGS